MNDACDALLESLKKVAVILKDAHIPFAVAGSYGVYARGGPTSEHDVDLLLRQADMERALKVLAEHGLRVAHPSEDWLDKVYDDDRLVDLIYRPSERPVDDAMLARSDELTVGAVRMPVLRATDLLVNKLLALSEHYCDFDAILPLVRALREQINWDDVRADTADSSYAESFLLLCERLDLVPDRATTGARRLREVIS
jgi:hypothetical protein